MYIVESIGTGRQCNELFNNFSVGYYGPTKNDVTNSRIYVFCQYSHPVWGRDYSYIAETLSSNDPTYVCFSFLLLMEFTPALNFFVN